jgi:hypothetical protein
VQVLQTTHMNVLDALVRGNSLLWSRQSDPRVVIRTHTLPIARHVITRCRVLDEVRGSKEAIVDSRYSMIQAIHRVLDFHLPLQQRKIQAA